MTRSHRSRGRAALVVLLVACALVLGALVALQLAGDTGEGVVDADSDALAPWADTDVGELGVGRVRAESANGGESAAVDAVDEREALASLDGASPVEAAHAVFGTVVDHVHGRRVAGAKLLLVAELPNPDDPSETTRVERSGVSSAEGTFLIEWPTALEPRVIVVADGYVELRRPTVPVDTVFEMRLAPAASIEVVAGGAFPVGESGGTAALIELRRGREGHRDPLLADLGEDGRARFTNLAPGEFFVSAGTPRTGVAFERLSLDAGESRVISLDLPLAVRLSGRVLEKDREVGIAGVEIRLRPSLQGVWRDVEKLREQTVRSDAAGRYEFSHVHPANSHIELLSPWGDRTERSLELAGSSGSIEYDFRIDGASALSGIVRDAHGKPVAGALVLIDSRTRSNWNKPDRNPIETSALSRVETDSRGFFRVDDMPAGPRLNLVAAWREDGVYDGITGPQSLSTVTQVRLAAGASRDDIELVLEPTASVSGVVRDDKGEPVDRARVEVYRDTSSRSRRWARTRTDSEGSFHIEGLLSGSHRVFASHDDHSQESESISLVEGQHTELAFELQSRSRISVVVLDESGNALSFATVTAYPDDDEVDLRMRNPRANTDRYGRATIKGLEPGAWRVSARAPNFERPKELPVVEVPGDAELEIVLQSMPVVERATVFGTVTTENGGVPRKLRFADRRGGSLEVEDGRFKLTGVKPGRAELVLTAQNCVSHHLGEVLLVPGGELDVGAIELEPASSLLVVVTGPDGKRMNKFSTRLSSLPVEEGGYGKDARSRWGQSIGRGRASFSGLPRRSWKLRVTSEGYKTHRQELVIDELSERVDVQLQLQAN